MNGGPVLSVLAAQAARRFAARRCLADWKRGWSFAEFDRDADRLATALRARHAPGERIALLMANRAEYLLLMSAIERASLVRVPINARSTENDVRVILGDCGASALVFDDSTAALARAAGAAPGLRLVPVDALEYAEPDARVLHRAQLSDLCSINYTSGSSGQPKGVMLTHGNWLNVTRNMLIDRDIRGDDRLAHIGPLSHASGSYFMPWFLRGATSHVVEGGRADRLLALIHHERITVFTCVPTALTRIVSDPGIGRHDLSSIRSIGYGAEPIPQGTLQKALAIFGPVMTANYGLTEAYMTVTVLAPHEHFVWRDGVMTDEVRVGCIGRPYTGVEVVLRTPDGTPVGEGEIGELTIRSEHVMQGYWGMEEQTKAVLRDGWLWSGDLGRRDAEGFITLVGRNKDMLISGGFNIYPQELEAVLTRHPEVLEAAVVGVPDADWGEAAVAMVVRAAGSALGEEPLRAWCRPVLGFRTPKRVHFVNELPKNSAGKVDKKRVRGALLDTENRNER